MRFAAFFRARRRDRIGGVVVGENPVRRTFEIVELPGSNRPPERRGDQQREHDGQRNQQQEDFHAVQPVCDAAGAAEARPAVRTRTRETRSALPTTTSDDADMPIAATSGVTKPAAAAGIAIAL